MSLKIDVRIVGALVLISVVSTYFIAPYLSKTQQVTPSTCAPIPKGRTLSNAVHDYSCYNPNGFLKVTFSVRYTPTNRSIPLNISLYTIDLTLVAEIKQNATGFFTATFPSKDYYFIEIQHETPWSEGGAEYFITWYLFSGNPASADTFFGYWNYGPADWPTSPYV